MAKTTSYRTLIWIIVILLATNLSMGITFLYHKQQDKKAAKKTEETAIEVPTEQRTRFFREQLNLTPEQVDQFRELNRDYNRTAWEITRQIESLRAEMVEEMGKPEPIQQRLDEITGMAVEMETFSARDTGEDSNSPEIRDAVPALTEVLADRVTIVETAKTTDGSDIKIQYNQ